MEFLAVVYQPRLGLRDTALRGPEGRDTRYGDTLGGSRGCKRIMASPRQDIPGRPDSTGESAPAPVATTVASTQRTVVSGAPASDEFRQSARAQVQAALEKVRNGSQWLSVQWRCRRLEKARLLHRYYSCNIQELTRTLTTMVMTTILVVQVDSELQGAVEGDGDYWGILVSPRQ